ncbi:MAG: peptide deformylase [Candidatus Pacebacteria bacterium]|nr:peptide deformylase [Candidatus Paceibacterota bacterium]
MDIVQKGDPVLRKKAAEVSLENITSPAVQKEITLMHQALATQHDGVALAAPQIGISKRIFVVAQKAYRTYTDQPLVFINPVIVKASKAKSWRDEGCLSVRWWYGKTHRHTQATVEAYNEHGEKFQLGGSGLVAQIFQHEIDHLDGILFDDHAKDLGEYTHEEVEQHVAKRERHKE